MTKTFNEVPEGFYLLLNFDAEGNQKSDEVPLIVKYGTITVKEGAQGKEKDVSKKVWAIGGNSVSDEDPRTYGFSLVPVNDVIALIKKDFSGIQHYN